MDPDVCLAELRDLQERARVEKRSTGYLMGVREPYEHLLEEIAERVEALDLWLTKGGFPPAAWRETRTIRL